MHLFIFDFACILGMVRVSVQDIPYSIVQIGGSSSMYLGKIRTWLITAKTVHMYKCPM